jgi:NAD(P)-dependent dehydrogenase (short-subunit alcohol dehydrogenase family)
MKPMSELTNLTGKTAVVTGGAVGIGFSVAHRLVEAGANVVIADIDETAWSFSKSRHAVTRRRSSPRLGPVRAASPGSASGPSGGGPGSGPPVPTPGRAAAGDAARLISARSPVPVPHAPA